MKKSDKMKGWHVVIVDDEPDSLEVAKRALRFHGAEVHMAGGGKQGLEVATETRPNVVLTDLSMPEFDGWQLLFHLREAEETSNIPVIALTAHAMKGDEERAMKAGFNGYITKPLSPLTLVDDILRILQPVEPSGA